MKHLQLWENYRNQEERPIIDSFEKFKEAGRDTELTSTMGGNSTFEYNLIYGFSGNNINIEANNLGDAYEEYLRNFNRYDRSIPMDSFLRENPNTLTIEQIENSIPKEAYMLFDGAIEKMTSNYLESALFTDEERLKEDVNDEYLDLEISNALKSNAKLDCTEFIKRCIESNITLDGYNLSQLGHDFWLTRNGHGTGFWDRKEIYRGNADDLSKIASTFGTVNLFIDSSGKIDGE